MGYLPLLSVFCVQRLLQNQFYYGLFEFKGETHQGTHKPTITKKLFDKCQEVMKDRGHIKTRRVEKTFPFRGLLACGECGCAITAELQKGHNYYRCTKKKIACSQKYVREELLTEQMKSFLQKVYLSSQDTEKVLRELDNDEQKAKASSGVMVQNLKSEIINIGAKLDKLLSAYLDEIVSAEEYVAQKQKLLSRKIELNEEIAEIENGSVSWLEPARAWIKSLNQADKLLSSGDKSEMTIFLKQIGSNHILFDKSFSFSPKKPFQILAERRASRREASVFHLRNPKLRCFLIDVRTFFDENPNSEF